MHVLKHGRVRSNYKCLCTFHALQIPNHLFVCYNKLVDLIKKILLAISCVAQTELGLLVQNVRTNTTCLQSLVSANSHLCDYFSVGFTVVLLSC